MSQFFTSGGQSIEVPASTSVLPMNIQDRCLIGWTGRISLQSKGLSRVFSNTTVELIKVLNQKTYMVSSVQSFSQVGLFVTLWTATHQASLSIPNTRNLLKFMSIELLMPSNHLTLCHPLLLLPSVFPSISVFSNESVLHIRWPKYWSFSFIISPSNEHSGLISFRMDWSDLLAVQGTLKSLLQHHS